MSETIVKLYRESLVISFCFFLFNGSAFPQGLDNIDPVGRFVATWFAEMVDVELVGNIAWVSGVGGLVAIDVRDPQNPAMFSRYNPSLNPYGPRYYHSAIGENLAYASGRLDGISVIDISNLNLFLVGVYIRKKE